MHRTTYSFFLAILVWCLIGGCARVPLPTQSYHVGAPGPLGKCADFFESLDRQTKAANVIDSGAFRVKNYPYLRTNRFLASLGDVVDNGEAFAAWIHHMQSLDQEARAHEIANLPESSAAVPDTENDRSGLYAQVVTCGNTLKAGDFHSFKHQADFIKGVSAPDEYFISRRFLGIYPLSSMFVYSGVTRWHTEVKQNFTSTPPANWQSIQYRPETTVDDESLHRIIGSMQRDALGIPTYSEEARKALFQCYAPVWQIQFEGEFDRIGTPIWNAQGVLEVDTQRPITYTLLSFTRFRKDILTQLNYIIWFPSRPKDSAFDIYGGFLDGINYRITLDNHHRPLLYETVHNCGCYYKAYPTNRLQGRQKIAYAEPPLILKAPEPASGKNLMTVSINSRTHHVQHIYFSSHKLSPPAMRYPLANYSQLRSLPYKTNIRKSMFRQDGIVEGSERLERHILWTTGVLSPGAMRQWGRHPVAFVGKRHFDDPFYMENMFLESDSQ
jgi:hypothetical protein